MAAYMTRPLTCCPILAGSKLLGSHLKKLRVAATHLHHIPFQPSHQLSYNAVCKQSLASTLA
jgi:hypothetical protein